MSYLASEWASEAAPVADTYERLVLMALAYRADDDGCGAWPSVTTLARTSLCDTETIKRRLRALRERNVIALGDQSQVYSIRADRRPRVYDLLIPYGWYSAAQLDKLERQRAEKGRPPLTAKNRPPIPAAPGKARRADCGVPNPNRRPSLPVDDTKALTEQPPQYGDHGHGDSDRVVDGGSVSRDAGALQEPQTNPPEPVLQEPVQPTASADADVGWLESAATPPGASETTRSAGEHLLRGLPPAYRLANHALPRGAAVLDRALAAGLSTAALQARLSDNMTGVANPAGVVWRRITTLETELDSGEAARSEWPCWCGADGREGGDPCDERTRLRMRRTDGIAYRCPRCHPSRTAPTSNDAARGAPTFESPSAEQASVVMRRGHVKPSAATSSVAAPSTTDPATKDP